MEAKKLREMSPDELSQKRRELKEEIFHLRLRRTTARLENPMKLRETRRDLARVETILKERQGVVISNRMQKTVVVAVERTVMHPKYKKYIRVRNKMKAHDEGKQCQIGDRVLIEETRPLSRDKRWRVSRILQRAVAARAEEP